MISRISRPLSLSKLDADLDVVREKLDADLDFVHEKLYEIEQRLERSEKQERLILKSLQMLIASLEAFEPYIEALQATDGLSSRSEAPGRQGSAGASLIVQQKEF